MYDKEEAIRSMLEDIKGRPIDELTKRLAATKILQNLFNIAGIVSIVLTLFFTNIMTVIMCGAALYYISHISCGFDDLNRVLRNYIDLHSDK